MTGPFIALLLGFCLDLILGDPPWLPHPVVGIGKLIEFLECLLRPKGRELSRKQLEMRGMFLVGVVVAVTFFLTGALVLVIGGLVRSVAGNDAGTVALIAADGFLLFQALATRSLADAARQVLLPLRHGDIAGARQAVSRIVGRDTVTLGAPELSRATIETVAENASDGVVAPLFYYVVGSLVAPYGGAALAMAYKAINTMDSMLGYKNERYLHFGRSAALLDDAANFIPARLTAALMILAAVPAGLGLAGAVRAGRVFFRDRKKHPSPNSAHPESACAGALGVQLGGDSTYGGRTSHKPLLGDPVREIEPWDIARANRLLYGAAFGCFLLSGIVLLCIV